MTSEIAKIVEAAKIAETEVVRLFEPFKFWVFLKN